MNTPPTNINNENRDWIKIGDCGIQCKIPISDLKIDHTYQRLEVNKKNTKNTAANFNWTAFGSIVVMQRQNGDKYVVDGQQRLLAAKLRGDIFDVPCTIFRSDGPSHEAKAFKNLNLNRTNVKTLYRYRASLMAGEYPETEIDAWLTSVGITMDNEKRPNASALRDPVSVTKKWLENKSWCKTAILLQREICEKDMHNQTTSNKIFIGLFYLLKNGIPVDKYIDKIVENGGREQILHNVKHHELHQIKSKHYTDRIAALAILDIINHRLHKKFRLSITENQ